MGGVCVWWKRPTGHGTGVLKTLIIEDDEEVAAYLASVLRERGHDPAIVANGRDGVQQVATLGPFTASFFAWQQSANRS